MKLLFILLFLLTNIFAATTINISQINDGIKTAPFQELSLIDTKLPSIDLAFSNELHWIQSKKSFFGWINKIAVVKFTLFNDSNETRTLFLRHARLGTDNIDFWVLKEKKVINHWFMGDRLPLAQRPIQSINSAVKITIQPKEELQIVSQITTSGVLDTNYEIFFEKTFLTQSKWQVVWWSIFSGVMLMLVLYNIVNFFGLKEKSFLIHSLYVIFVTINNLGIYGFLYYLNLTDDYKLVDTMLYTTMPLALMFHILYPIFLFSLKEKTPKLTYILITISIIYGLIGSYFIFGYWNQDILKNAKYILVSATAIWIVIFLVSIYIISKNYTGSLFYFLSQIFVIFRVIYLVLILNSDSISMGLQAAMLSSFFVIMEALFITIGMSYRINKELKEKEFHQNIAKLYERYIYMGSYTSNIIHQWKSPLNHLGTLVTLLKAYNDKNIEINKEEYQSQLKELETITENLTKISAEVYGYLSNTSSTEPLNIKELITNVFRYFEKDIQHVEIQNIDRDVYITANRATLSQILLVLISNSLNIFKQRDIKNPKIEFFITKEVDGSYKFYVKDNGGGVDKKISHKIFCPYITTTNGLGSGLFVAKKLVTDKLSGNLILQNDKNELGGATFVICAKDSYSL
ncbi:MAG: sensor histidine kinase [Sulfurimonas denitrificans]|nr:sensor histidine kinase [Sulfurimonas denitrificans]